MHYLHFRVVSFPGPLALLSLHFSKAYASSTGTGSSINLDLDPLL